MESLSFGNISVPRIDKSELQLQEHPIELCLGHTPTLYQGQSAKLDKARYYINSHPWLGPCTSPIVAHLSELGSRSRPPQSKGCSNGREKHDSSTIFNRVAVLKTCDTKSHFNGMLATFISIESPTPMTLLIGGNIARSPRRANSISPSLICPGI